MPIGAHVGSCCASQARGLTRKPCSSISRFAPVGTVPVGALRPLRQPESISCSTCGRRANPVMPGPTSTKHRDDAARLRRVDRRRDRSGPRSHRTCDDGATRNITQLAATRAPLPTNASAGSSACSVAARKRDRLPRHDLALDLPLADMRRQLSVGTRRGYLAEREGFEGFRHHVGSTSY